MSSNENQAKNTIILESFNELVRSPYGNFTAIGKLAQALNAPDTLQNAIAALSSIPQCQQAFSTRNLLKIDLPQLHQLPHHTLGYLYADHMLQNGLTPLSFNKIVDNSADFLNAHIAQTHDIWHVVTGANTDKQGEVKLEAFCVAQLNPDRLFIALLAKNLLKTAMDEIELCEQIMDGLVQGWMMGKRAKPLFGIQWNQFWTTSLADVRSSLLITPQP
jgi:ubiquinone biosynthesis protein COQ4